MRDCDAVGAVRSVDGKCAFKQLIHVISNYAHGRIRLKLMARWLILAAIY